MFKKTLVAALLAVSLPAIASDYYVVVPVPSRTATDGNILVTLTGYTLPAGVVGRAYTGFNFNSVLQVKGDPNFNAGAVRWSIAGGTLPAGLSLTADGKLTGAPTSAATSSFQVLASYKTKAGQQAYQVFVADVSVTLAADSAMPLGTQGAAYSYDLKSRLAVTGDAQYTPAQVAWSVASGALPTGLQLNTDGTITGVPAAEGTYPFTIKATYLNKAGAQSYQVVVGAITVSLFGATLPVLTAGTAMPGYDLKQNLAVTGDAAYSSGGTGVTWSATGLPAGLTVDETGHIVGTPTAVGSASVAVTASYKQKSSAPATYSMTVNANIKDNGAYRSWSDGTYANSCAQYLNAGSSGVYTYTGATGDGVYRVNASGSLVDVYCDMTRDGGGWALVMRAAGGSVWQDTNWVVAGAVNGNLASSATAPKSTTSWKLSDSTLNQVRGSAGVYRLISDGTVNQKRFWKAFAYATVTKLAVNTPATISYADLSWNGAKAATSWVTGAPGGLSDDGGVWDVYFDTSRTGDAWALSNGQANSYGAPGCTSSQAGCNFTMWVR